MSISEFLENKRKLVVMLFFFAYLLTGLSLYKDYGISWDEEFQRATGLLTFDYVFKHDPSLLNHRDKYYGIAFEFPLICIERALNLFKVTDSRQIYFMRHLMTFLLFWTSTIFFYLLSKKIFNDWKISLLGTTFLILSPRIFGHSFYNPKDIPLLSLFIITAYTMMRYLENKTIGRASLHALTCAILIDIRIVGLLMPLLTLVLAWLDVLSRNPSEKIKTGYTTALFTILVISLTILLWPILWHNPPLALIESIRLFSRFTRIDMPLIYMGGKVKSTNVPWHYIPVWIFITTPLLYVSTFFFGAFISIKDLLKKPLKIDSQKINYLLVLAWFFMPILTAIALKSVLFDSWRHMFFVYPAFILIATAGLKRIFELVENRLGGKIRKTAFSLITFAMTISLLNTTYFMIKLHPYESEYFNWILAWDMRFAKTHFEMFGWGQPYREGLEYILKKDKRDQIKVYASSLPGKYNAKIIKPNERNRLVYVEFPRQADYYLTDSVYKKKEESYFQKKFYAVRVGQAIILRVYKAGK
jgi:hypothetical protein